MGILLEELETIRRGPSEHHYKILLCYKALMCECIFTHVAVKVLVKVNRGHRSRPLLFDAAATAAVRVGRFGGQQIVAATTAPVTGGVTAAVVLALAGHRRSRHRRTVVINGESRVVLQVIVGRRYRRQVTALGIDRVTVTVTGRHRGRGDGHAAINDATRHVPVTLFLLHPSVLEPYLYLPFGQVQLCRHLLSLAAHYVLGRPEHRLQHGRLVLGISLPGPFAA